MKLEIRANKFFRIYGPASISVVQGRISILGRQFSPGEKAVVHRMRSYCVFALEDSVLEVTMAGGASIQEPSEGEEPFPTWVRVAEEIAEEGLSKAVVLGGIDSGKSSFSILLANMALQKGRKVAVIDSDVGQADIGPPAFISMALYDRQVIWMRELEPTIMRFIGDIRPQHYIDKIIYEVEKLASIARHDYSTDLVVIDTDGWIHDSYALNYKSKLIEHVKPDALVVLGNSAWGFYRRYSRLGIKVYELNAPINARSRSREERKWLRSEKYRKFLEQAGVKRYRFEDVLLTGFPLFMGQELDPTEVSGVAGVEVLYATRSPDMMHIVTPAQPRALQMDRLRDVYGVVKIRVYNSGFERGLYVALTGEGYGEYPGLVQNIDFRDRSIAIKTMYSGKPLVIKFSRIRLTPEYTEQLIE